MIVSDRTWAGSGDCEGTIRTLAGACLMAFAVAYGDSGKMLLTASAMLMSPKYSSGGASDGTSAESLVMPSILVNLQRSVISVILGTTHHPDFMTRGVMQDDLCETFPVEFPTNWKHDKSEGKKNIHHTLPRVYAQASDGSHLYLQTGLVNVTKLAYPIFFHHSLSRFRPVKGFWDPGRQSLL